MRKTVFFLLTCAFVLSAGNLMSQDFVYKPKNPAFGGDTFNYNWLLSSAQAQDLHVDTRPNRGLPQRNSAQDFAESLNRLLLSQLSRELILSQFGENGLTDGLYTLGDFQVDVATTLEGLTITIFDVVQGAQTQIVIPFF
jgi:curli production assembly/transport component CsgF